jgi:hypothetical protein
MSAPKDSQQRQEEERQRKKKRTEVAILLELADSDTSVLSENDSVTLHAKSLGDDLTIHNLKRGEAKHQQGRK